MQFTGGLRNTHATSTNREQFSCNYSPTERKDEDEIFQLKFASLLNKVLEKDRCTKRSLTPETESRENILSSDSTKSTGSNVRAAMVNRVEELDALSPLTHRDESNENLKLEDQIMEKAP